MPGQASAAVMGGDVDVVRMKADSSGCRRPRSTAEGEPVVDWQGESVVDGHPAVRQSLQEHATASGGSRCDSGAVPPLSPVSRPQHGHGPLRREERGAGGCSGPRHLAPHPPQAPRPTPRGEDPEEGPPWTTTSQPVTPGTNPGNAAPPPTTSKPGSCCYPHRTRICWPPRPVA